MSHLTLLRLESNAKQTNGILLVDGEVFCSTIEPPKRNNKEDESCINTGLYQYKKYDSEKFDCVCLKISDVFERKDIAIHYGNDVFDTTGCILVGQLNAYNHNTIFDSKYTLKELVKKILITGTISIKEYS